MLPSRGGRWLSWPSWLVLCWDGLLTHRWSCCCCDSPVALLLSSVVQVEEVCDRSWVVWQVLHCKLSRMALTVEQMLYGVWYHSTLRTDIWWCGSCHCSKADSDQNATGREWYGLTLAAVFQQVKYRVVKLQGLCLVQMVIRHCTNRGQRWVTLLIEISALPLSTTANQIVNVDTNMTDTFLATVCCIDLKYILRRVILCCSVYTMNEW